MEDTILIKINKSYVEGMSAEELYKATSISWVISVDKLEEGNLKYFCAVYQNNIKEVYELHGHEPDQNEGKEARFILIGRLASDEIRNKLINLDVSNFHKGKGNPIKYNNLETLLNSRNKNQLPNIKENDEEIQVVEKEEELQKLDDIFISGAMQYNIIELLKYKKTLSFKVLRE